MLPVRLQQQKQFCLHLSEDIFTVNLEFKFRCGTTQKIKLNNFINREKNITVLISRNLIEN